MVNLPQVLRPLTAEDKAWLDARFDLLKQIIEAGEPVTFYDSTEAALLDGELTQTMTMHLSVPDEVWMRHYRASRS